MKENGFARLLAALVSAVAIATSAFGVDFETLVGSDLPSLYSIELKPYLEDLVDARNAEIDAIPRTVYYVDSSVGSSGVGTAPATALKEISDVQTVINAGSGSQTFLFRTGKSWSTSTALTIDEDNCKIGTYTSDTNYAPPLIHHWTESATGSWTSNSDSGSTNDGIATYYRTLASEPGWLIEATSDLTKMSPLRYRDSLADCQATSRSWFWDSGASRLYIHYSADPASISFLYSLESGADNDATIIVNDCTGTLIEGIRVEGNGATAITDNVGYGIRATGTANGTLVVRDCQSYYNGYHNFGSTAGGICLFERCRAGYTWHSAGATTYVFFKSVFSSDDECIFSDCAAMAGPLPHETITAATTNYTGFYAHRAEAMFGGSGSLGLCVCFNCSEPGPLPLTNATATIGTTSFTDMPGDDSLSTIRGLWVNHDCARDAAALTRIHGNGRQAYINCRWRFTLPAGDSGALWPGASTGGTYVNCIWDIADNVNSTQRQMIYTQAQRYQHCSWYMRGSGNSWIWGSVAGSTIRADNCLLSNLGSRAFANGASAASGLNNDDRWGTVALANCNLAVDGNGFGMVSGRVLLPRPLEPYQTVKGTLAETGATAGGPDYDYYWRRRPTTGGSLGAIEANPSPDATTQDIYDYIQTGVKLRRAD